MNEENQLDPNQSQQQVQPVVQIDPAQLQQILAQQQQVQQPAPRTINDMTPEERAEYLQIFDPSQDDFDQRFVEALQNTEDPNARRQMLGTFRDGIVNQALRGAELLIEQQLGQFKQQLAPAIQISREQLAEKAWNEFSTAHPELKNQRQLVDAISIQISSDQSYRPTSKKDLFDRVASATKQVLEQSGITLPAPSSSQQQQSSQVQVPRMSQQRTVQGSPTSAPPAQGDQRIAPFFLRRQR